MSGRFTRRGNRSLADVLSDLVAAVRDLDTVQAVPLALLVAGAAANLGLYAYHAALGLTTPYTFDPGEGMLFFYATNWSALFDPIATEPFVHTPYPPLYVLIVGTVETVVGDVVLAGRLVTITATLCTAVLVARIVARQGHSDRVTGAVVAAVLFVSSPLVTHWGVYARVDMLGICFGVAAIYWYLTRSDTRQLVGCIVLCLLALYTKQTFVFVPGAIALALLIEASWRRALVFSIGLNVVGLGILVLLNVVTDGQAWLHLVVYNVNEFSVVDAVTKSLDVLQRHAAVLSLAAVGIVGLRARVPTVVTSLLVLGGAFGLLIGKTGARGNYYLGFVVAAIVVTGIVVDAMLEYDRPSSGDVNWAPLLIAFLLVGQFGLFLSYGGGPFTGSTQAERIVEDAEGPVVSGDIGLLVTTGQEVSYEPFQFGRLSDQGIWEEGAIVENIQTHRYEYVVLRGRLDGPREELFRWTDAQLAALSEHYRLVEQTGGYWIYAPDPSAQAATAADTTVPARRSAAALGAVSSKPENRPIRSGPERCRRPREAAV